MTFEFELLFRGNLIHSVENLLTISHKKSLFRESNEKENALNTDFTV